MSRWARQRADRYDRGESDYPREGCTRARRCMSLGCDECLPVRLGDWRRSFSANLAAHGASAVMTTLTGPGREVLPLDDAGRCLEEPLERWTATRDARWRRLHQAAQQAAHRATGLRAHRIVWAWEPHARGCPHVHIALDTSTPALTRAAQHYVAFLVDNHLRYGFGWPDKWSHCKRFSHPAQLSRYLAGYLTPSPSQRKSMASNFRSLHMPRRPLGVSRALTLRTGITQRNLRRHRHVHAWARLGVAERPVWWGDVSKGFLSYLRALPLLDPELAAIARAP